MDTKKLATVAGAAAAGGVLAFAGLSLANAATGGSGAAAPGQQAFGMRGPHGTPVTGETADQVEQAVLAQYPDATVLHVEEEDGGYEAHVRKSDGTMVHVTLDADFAITGEHTGPAMGRPGMRGPHGEKQLKGAKAKKVRAAAEKRVPGGIVVRVEKDSDGVYEAHVVKKNGRMVVVEVGKRFQVTGVEAMRAHHGGPHGGPPPWAGGDATNPDDQGDTGA